MSNKEIEFYLRELNRKLLTSEYGVDEESFSTLDLLNIIVLGHDGADEISDQVDAVDGYFFIPIGNLVEPEVECFDDLAE